ncbi:MAG: hypothetical protein M3512_16045 [Bacteroidota bacterium]|nr:hypothetical protein [Bacteroidota bacterium]
MKNYYFVLIISLLTFSCFPKNSLKKKNITSLAITVNPENVVIPGAMVEIGLTAATDAAQFNTKGFLNGNINWNNYNVEVTGGRFSRGKIFVDKNLDISKTKSIIVNIKPKHHEGILLIEEIKLNHLVDIKVTPIGRYNKAPGSHVPVQILGEFDNGIYLDLVAQKLPINNLEIAVDGGKYIKGKICINEDPYSILNHAVGLFVRSKLYPHAKDSLVVNLDYKSDYKFSIRGSHGSTGWSGSDGANGSTDHHGGHGENGQHGSSGYHGRNLEVIVESYHSPGLGELVLVDVFEKSGPKLKSFIINPDGGSLNIQSRGGDGGNGGSGGSGGNGGSGRDGEKFVEKIQVNDSTIVEEITYDPGTCGGDGGYGGHGGDGGQGGNGGNIQILYSETAAPFLPIIRAASLAGTGGFGGSRGVGGSGGRGGKGSPDGCDGASGDNGTSGFNGFSGDSGRVRVFKITDVF